MEDKKNAVMNGELTEQDVAETNAKLASEELDGVSGGIALCAEDKALLRSDKEDGRSGRAYMENASSELRGSVENNLRFVSEQKLD